MGVTANQVSVINANEVYPPHTYIEHTAGADITAGSPFLLNSAPAFSMVDITTGKIGNLIVIGPVKCYTTIKLAGEAWTAGDTLYWDDAAKKITTVVASNAVIGLATKAAASADTVGYLLYTGKMAIV